MGGEKARRLFPSRIFHLKRIFFDGQPLLTWLRNPAQRGGSGTSSSYSTLNVLKVSAGHRNVRKLGAFNVKKENGVSMQHNTGSRLFGITRIFNFVVNRKKLEHDFQKPSTILKFHLQKTLLENFFLKHSKKLLSIMKKTVSKEDVEKQWGGPEAYKLIIFIKDDFNEVVNKHPTVVVFFSADWCQHCLRLRAQYGTAALMAKEANLPIVFATFDVTTNPDIADENGVVGIPTVKYYKNGKVVSTFRGKRTADDLFAYVKNPPQTLTEIKKADF